MIPIRCMAEQRCSSGRREEAGFALIVAMFALVIMGALVAAGFFAGRLEQQSGQNVFYAAQAREAAEAGLAQALSVVASSAPENLPVQGAPLDMGTMSVGEATMAQTVFVRLTSGLFLIRSEGTRRDVAGGVLATRLLGLLVQVPSETASGLGGGELQTVAPLRERGWVRLY